MGHCGKGPWVPNKLFWVTGFGLRLRAQARSREGLGVPPLRVPVPNNWVLKT